MLYGGVRYLLYLLSWVDKPSWLNVFGMAAILFLGMVVYGLWTVIVAVYRFKKDPVYYHAYKATGISYESYKRLTKSSCMPDTDR